MSLQGPGGEGVWLWECPAWGSLVSSGPGGQRGPHMLSLVEPVWFSGGGHGVTSSAGAQGSATQGAPRLAEGRGRLARGPEGPLGCVPAHPMEAARRRDPAEAEDWWGLCLCPWSDTAALTVLSDGLRPPCFCSLTPGPEPPTPHHTEPLLESLPG